MRRDPTDEQYKMAYENLRRVVQAGTFFLADRVDGVVYTMIEGDRIGQGMSCLVLMGRGHSIYVRFDADWWGEDEPKATNPVEARDLMEANERISDLLDEARTWKEKVARLEQDMDVLREANGRYRLDCQRLVRDNELLRAGIRPGIDVLCEHSPRLMQDEAKG